MFPWLLLLDLEQKFYNAAIFIYKSSIKASFFSFCKSRNSWRVRSRHLCCIQKLLFKQKHLLKQKLMARASVWSANISLKIIELYYDEECSDRTEHLFEKCVTEAGEESTKVHSHLLDQFLSGFRALFHKRGLIYTTYLRLYYMTSTPNL